MSDAATDFRIKRCRKFGFCRDAILAMYEIHEVDGPTHAETLHKFNQLEPTWPALQGRHLEQGFWWIAYLEDKPVAFAGLTPMTPFVGYGYLKRCYVKPDHHGRGLQYRMLLARELKARQLGWTHLVSECSDSNQFSANNFRRAGYETTDPEQPWGQFPSSSMYWVKALV